MSTTTGLPAAETPRTSTSRMIADALRTAIVDGSLAPDAPLRQDAIARHFSVSAIPVREALRQLASEGWAKIEVNKGASVASLSADEAREIYEIRSALESLALGIAIPQHTAATLREATSLYNAAKRERDPSLYVARNEAFHKSLYAPAARAQLLEMIATLHRRGERYLRLKLDFPQYKGESDAEHAEILAAVKRGETAAAQSLVAAHLLGTGELIYRFLTTNTPADEAAAPRARRPRPSSSRTRS
ncbi:GntR family transcriptional regulator [Paraburkholderia caballeronis]|uniref:GntR family transcriptional regulator n=1 Tax=Paraburkholderia caballeronis TaxID=416943 RepID=UPI001065A931|nr:GntR family transcriptional regulator [Paraburkholderia caballeronis]TDV26768.1 GntR family transcriptional regulator [Paraburkholderia caballeronis]